MYIALTPVPSLTTDRAHSRYMHTRAACASAEPYSKRLRHPAQNEQVLFEFSKEYISGAYQDQAPLASPLRKSSGLGIPRTHPPCRPFLSPAPGSLQRRSCVQQL